MYIKNHEEERKSFVIYDNFLQATKKMTDHEFREAIWIMRDYALEGKEPSTESPLVDTWMTMARPNIDYARERYEQSVINGAKGKNYGWLGGRPAKQNQKTPNNPQKPLNVNEDRNEDRKENVKENRDEDEEKICTYVDDNGVVHTHEVDDKAIQEWADAYESDLEYENAHIDDPPAEINYDEFEQQKIEAWEYWERQRRKEEGEDEDEDYYYDDNEEDDTVPTNSSNW